MSVLYWVSQLVRLKKNPRKLRRFILQFIAKSENVTSLEDEGMSVLLTISDQIHEIKGRKVNPDTVQLPETEQQHYPVAKTGTVSIEVNGEKYFIFSLNAADTVPAPNTNPFHPLYRRDFKIIGQMEKQIKQIN